MTLCASGVLSRWLPSELSSSVPVKRVATIDPWPVESISCFRELFMELRMGLSLDFLKGPIGELAIAYPTPSVQA